MKYHTTKCKYVCLHVSSTYWVETLVNDYEILGFVCQLFFPRHFYKAWSLSIIFSFFKKMSVFELGLTGRSDRLNWESTKHSVRVSLKNHINLRIGQIWSKFEFDREPLEPKGSRFSSCFLNGNLSLLLHIGCFFPLFFFSIFWSLTNSKRNEVTTQIKRKKFIPWIF